MAFHKLSTWIEEANSFTGEIFARWEKCCQLSRCTVSNVLRYIILIYSPGLKYSITFPLIAHMPLIDILILAICRMFNGLSSHESPVAQWQSVRTSNRKVVGSTPVGRTRNFFFRVCLCHY